MSVGREFRLLSYSDRSTSDNNLFSAYELGGVFEFTGDGVVVPPREKKKRSKEGNQKAP